MKKNSHFYAVYSSSKRGRTSSSTATQNPIDSSRRKPIPLVLRERDCVVSRNSVRFYILLDLIWRLQIHFLFRPAISLPIVELLQPQQCPFCTNNLKNLTRTRKGMPLFAVGLTSPTHWLIRYRSLRFISLLIKPTLHADYFESRSNYVYTDDFQLRLRRVRYNASPAIEKLVAMQELKNSKM